MSKYAEFVESHLTSVRCLEKEKRVEIVFSLATGAECALIAEGVSRMLIQEMREQNIVESICIHDSKSEDEDLQWAARMLAVPDESTGSAVYAPIIESIVNQITTGEQVLMVVTPVYGAMVVVLATKVWNFN
jgi:hypothetical protein